ANDRTVAYLRFMVLFLPASTRPAHRETCSRPPTKAVRYATERAREFLTVKGSVRGTLRFCTLTGQRVRNARIDGCSVVRLCRTSVPPQLGWQPPSMHRPSSSPN